MIEVVGTGMLDLVMDLGRPGFRSQGVPECGAADSGAMIVANRLVGNSDSSAGLEMLFRGPRLKFPEGGRIAIVGAEMEASIDGVSVPCAQTVDVNPGSTLDVGLAKRGLRAYLAVAGGVDVPEVLGSRSTFLPGGFGGLLGRALRSGDVLPTGTPTNTQMGRADGAGPSGPFRVLPGPQLARFSDLAMHALMSDEYILTPDSNRLGLRLSGPPLEYRGDDLASQGVLPGAIQVPPDGQPIILGWDGPVTGGYAVIAGIISADLHRLAQLRPGDRIAFRFIGLEEAQKAAVEAREFLNRAITWQN